MSPRTPVADKILSLTSAYRNLEASLRASDAALQLNLADFRDGKLTLTALLSHLDLLTVVTPTRQHIHDLILVERFEAEYANVSQSNAARQRRYRDKVRLREGEILALADREVLRSQVREAQEKLNSETSSPKSKASVDELITNMRRNYLESEKDNAEDIADLLGEEKPASTFEMPKDPEWKKRGLI